jgi:hypothetical protein
VTWNIANAAHDDIADFPFSVRANNRQEVGEAHRCQFSS